MDQVHPMQDCPQPQFYPLQMEYIGRELQGSSIGQALIYHERLPSTMPVAHRLIQDAASPAACSGTVIVAEEQTAGRGRLQRRWETPLGRALLTSIIVAAPHLPAEPAQIPMIAGLATLDALRTVAPALARHLWLKWPNDLIVVGDGVVGKLAGALIESSFGAQGIEYAVLGIGINVNQRAHELPDVRQGGLRPSSLYTLLGRDLSREDLLVALCHALASLLPATDRPDPVDIHRRWQAALINLGNSVCVRGDGANGPGQIEGQVLGTTLTGSLIIRQVNGEKKIVEAGDVEFQWRHSS